MPCAGRRHVAGGRHVARGRHIAKGRHIARGRQIARGGTLQGADTLQGEGTLQGGGMLEEASNYLGSVADTHLTGYVCLGGKFDGQFSSNNFVIDDGFGEAAYVEMTPV